MLRARLATAAVAIPLLLLLFLYGPQWLFALFVASIAMLGIAEIAAMMHADRPRERAAALASGVVLVAGVASGRADLTLFALMTMIVGAFVWILLLVPDFQRGLRDFGIFLVGLLYVGLFLPHFILLHSLEPDGRYLAVLVVAVGMAGDSSGYFVGRAYGRHKLIPAVSPGKTVEGALGILVGSVLGAALIKALWLPSHGWAEIVGVSLVMSVLGQLGDLSESAIKRTFGTKESGWLFPGHGGVLDRIDSLLFPVAFLYYYETVLR